MSTKRWLNLWLAAAAVIALATQPALARKPVVPSTISGTVTSSAVNGEIAIDGHTYHIQAQSQAAAEAANLLAGTSVRVKLSGSPDSKASEVVEIHATDSR